MLAKQEGRCGICRELFDDDHPARIDRTADGTVRGLLCPRCRAGLSTFRDDADRVRAAVGYLMNPVLKRGNASLNPTAATDEAV
jgi:hypothetical protein